MKYIKFFLFYLLSFLLISNIYDETTLLEILFHYSFIDFRYLIFIVIQIFWITLFFQIIYQYICLFQFMHIRLSFLQCIKFLIKKFIIYCFIYLISHFLLLTAFSYHIPLCLIYLNLIIQTISFIFILFLHKEWDNSYVFIIGFVLFLHIVA